MQVGARRSVNNNNDDKRMRLPTSIMAGYGKTGLLRSGRYDNSQIWPLDVLTIASQVLLLLGREGPIMRLGALEG